MTRRATLWQLHAAWLSVSWSEGGLQVCAGTASEGGEEEEVSHVDWDHDCTWKPWAHQLDPIGTAPHPPAFQEVASLVPFVESGCRIRMGHKQKKTHFSQQPNTF